jgi:hypothetical protein
MKHNVTKGIVIAAILAAVALALQTGGVQPEENRLFCTKGSPINVCFELSSVSMFVAHDSAVILNGGYSWTMPNSDWARLVAFGKSRSYDIPEQEGSR